MTHSFKQSILVNGQDVKSTNPLPVLNFGSLVPDSYDYIALTYVAAGNGAGEVETVTYKDGGAGGTTVAVLTLTYNSDDEVATITRT